ncbi:MAG: hypothetical protein ACD_41C00346G0003 [uncultured bacterium]|nr:MAG: hypothetical protein ACD_41C00346G0003 [uncultured bacterium]HBY73636.1 hypothetical protein [Candidatus Kerfeldbacteria bacterium]
MKLYKDVLRQAWEHTIHRPGLWIFGFFATFVFGASGELDRYLRFMNGIVTDGDLLNPKSWLDGRWLTVATDLWNAMLAGQVNAWLFSVGIVIAAIIMVGMVSIAVGALVHSAVHKTESFGEAFQAGAQHMIQLFVLFVTGYLVIVVATLALVTAVLKLAPVETFQSQQLLITVVAGVVFIPLVIVVSLIIRLASMAVVVDGNHIGTALGQAWRLFCKHWLVVIEMAIISFLLVGVVSLGLLVGLTVIFLPVFLGVSFGGEAAVLVRIQNASWIGQWLYLLLSFFSAAIISTWQWSAWTLLFQALRTDNHSSTLVRWIREVK